MNTTKTIVHPRPAVSVFWPIVLIGVGIIWLMANQGIIVRNPFELVLRFFPVLFIVAGCQILFGRTGFLGTLVSAALGVAVVVGAMFYLTTPGELPLPAWFNWGLVPSGAELQTADLGQPMDDAESLQVDLHLPSGFGSIKPTTNPVNLIEGQLKYSGKLTNRVERNSGSVSMLLESDTQNNRWFDSLLRFEQWDVRLNPRVPLTLNLTVGSGAHDFDLRAFAIRDISLHQGSGLTTFHLPQDGQYHFSINVGSGVTNIALPRGIPARVTYDLGSGWLSVNGMQRVTGTEKHGAYETDNFNQNSSYILFDLHMGSGLVVIR